MEYTDVNKTYDKMNNRLDDPDYYMGDYVNLLLDYNPIALYAADRGLYKSVATQLTAASSQYWSVAHNSSLRFTTAMSVSFWVYRDTAVADKAYVTKWNYSTDGGWSIQSGNAAANTIAIYIATSAGDIGSGCHMRFNADLGTAAWHHVCVIFDGSLSGDANRLKVYLDGVQKTLTVIAGAVPASLVADTADLRIGDFQNLARYIDGRIDSVRIWSRVLTASDVASEYNGGVGKVYDDLTNAEKVSLAASYDFDGDGLDSHGTNHLTAVNSPTYVAGKPNKVASANGDTIAVWQDQSGNGHHMSQTILSKRPTLSLTGGPHNTPCIVSDGSDDYMITTTQLTTFPNKRGAIIGIIKSPSGGSYPAVCSIYPSSTGNWLAYGDDTVGAPKALFYDGTVRVAALQDGTSTILKTWHRNTDISMLHRRNHVLADTLTLSDNQAPVGVMSMYSAMGANIWGGKISVLALFPNLTTSQICDIEAILNKKFRIY